MKPLKILLCSAIALSAAAATAAAPRAAGAHEGEVDSLGCHYGRNHRDYHCHKGLYAGMSFPSRGYLMRNYGRFKAEAEKKQAEKKGDDDQR